MGYVELVAVGIGFGLVALAVVVRALRYDIDRDARSWASAYGVRLTDANSEFVRGYLRTGRRLRFVCSVAGFLLPPLVVHAVDPNSHSGPSFGGLIAGYMIGSLWAGLSPARSTPGATRAATLAPRRLEDYLPGRLRWGLWVIGGLTSAMAVAGTVVERPEYPSVTVSGSLMWIAGMAVAVAAAVEAAQRWILRRPQPFVAPDLVEADDAVRSSSIHALAGSGICCLLLLAIAPALVLADSRVQLLRWTMPWVALASLLGAGIAVRYYVYRAWRVRRPGPRVAVGG